MRNKQASIDQGPAESLDRSRVRRERTPSRKHSEARPSIGARTAILQPLSILALIAMMVGAMSLPGVPVHAAPTGQHFDHIVFIAMENTDEGSVIGCSCAPFIN